jgi:hypothetical protein
MRADHNPVDPVKFGFPLLLALVDVVSVSRATSLELRRRLASAPYERLRTSYSRDGEAEGDFDPLGFLALRPELGVNS